MAQLLVLGAKENRGDLSPNKEFRKLKIQLSDRIFELKKLQEDYAEEKAHLIMQFNQERASLNTIIRDLKDKIQDENEHWAMKFDQLRNQHSQILAKVNQEWEQKLCAQIAKQIKESKVQFITQKSQLQAQLQTLTHKLIEQQKYHEKAVCTLKESHKQLVSQLKHTQEAEIEQLKQKIGKDEELKISAIMHMKANQQKQHEATKAELAHTRKTSSQHIKSLQQTIHTLTLQLSSTSISTQTLQSTVSTLQSQLNQYKQSHKHILTQTIASHTSTIHNLQQTHKSHINSLNQHWRQEYKKIQVAYQKLQCLYGEKEGLWENRGLELLREYQNREARGEDVRLIQHLEVELIRKEFQLEREKQELRCCKLELDNMDQIYKRIFHSGKKNHRHSNSFQLKRMRLPGISKTTNPVKPEND